MFHLWPVIQYLYKLYIKTNYNLEFRPLLLLLVLQTRSFVYFSPVLPISVKFKYKNIININCSKVQSYDFKIFFPFCGLWLLFIYRLSGFYMKAPLFESEDLFLFFKSSCGDLSSIELIKLICNYKFEVKNCLWSDSEPNSLDFRPTSSLNNIC